MKYFGIPIVILVMLFHVTSPLYAQGPRRPVRDLLNSVADDMRNNRQDQDNPGQKKSNNKQIEGDDDVSPSPTPNNPQPFKPSPTPVITVPSIELPIPVIGGNKHEKFEEEEEIEETPTPTPTVSPRSVRAPASVQSSQRQMIEQVQDDESDENETPVAAITKPIEPPLELVRGAVKGSFYNSQGLSQEITFYSFLISFLFISLGALLLRSEIISFLIRRGRYLPLPKQEPFTIPYIGNRYK